MSDSQLISVIRQSRNEGYRQLVNEYGNYVYTIVVNRLRGSVSECDIEECVSDVFIEVIMNYDKYSFEESSLKGFIAAVAGRRAVDVYRRVSAEKNRIADTGEIPETASDDTERLSEEKEIRRELWSKVNELGEPDSQIIVLQYFYGKSVQEIAARLKMSTAAVYKRSLRARGKLKKNIKKERKNTYEYQTGQIS